MEPLPHQITTLTRTDRQADERLQHPPMVPADLPPGVELVTLPGGARTLAYTHPAPTPAPAVQPAVPAQSVPRWAKTTALLAPTVGVGVAGAGWGLSYAAPGLIAMSHALWATVALIAAGGAVAIGLINARRKPASITQNITASGLFGRAHGTINQ